MVRSVHFAPIHGDLYHVQLKAIAEEYVPCAVHSLPYVHACAKD